MERAQFVTSAFGLLAAVDPWNDEVLDRGEALEKYRAEHEGSLADAEEALGIPLDPQMVAVSISVMVRDWLGGGAKQMIHLKDHLLLRDWKDGTDGQRFVWFVVCMLEPLAHIELKNGFDELSLLAEAAAHCRSAARFALAHESAPAAIDTLTAAATMTMRADLSVHLELSAEALRIARSLNDGDRAARQALRHAFGLLFSATRGRGTWTEALDAFENVLRNPPDGEEALKECAAGVIFAARKDELRALRPWISMTLGDVPQELAAHVEGLNGYLPLVFDGDMQAFSANLQRIVELVQIAEDERVKMLGASTDHKARADWATWSLRHDAFRSAIPHGNSFLRERDLQQLMLVLNHELTHMLSMSSGIGLAIIALRAALTQVEIELWEHGVRGDTEAAIEGVKRGLAPLERDDLTTLALVERELEMMLKLRVLQDVWAPWFEGIAIAQEFADPREDPDTYQPAMSVLMGMVDGAVKNEPEDTEASFAAKVTAYFQQFEVAYGDAVTAQGPARQRSYLTPPDARNYLPAIITVRSVVAGWRKALGRSLSGTLGSRILMHVTRFGTNECLPDLGLPFAGFRAEAIRLHLEWVKWVARLRADQLQATLDLGSTEKPGPIGGFWRDGELVPWKRGDEAALDKRFFERLRQLAKQAYASLIGTHAPVERVPDGSAECRAILQAMGDSLIKSELSDDLARDFTVHYLGLLRVLPVGEVDGPFWLLPQGTGFCVLIRTTEKHYKHGEPAYNVMLNAGLAKADFEALHKEVRRIQHARMRVTRFVDLTFGGLVEGRGYGRHVLVFQYGEWKCMLPVGLLLGGSAIGESLRVDIEDRLRSSPLAELDMRFLSDGIANAQRARGWLDGIDQWTLQGKPVAIDSWADHVRELADELEHPTAQSDRETVGGELLRLMLGPNVPTEQAMQDGLRALRSDDAGSPGEASRLLFAVGRAPVARAEAEADYWPSLFAVTDGFVDVATPTGPFANGG